MATVKRTTTTVKTPARTLPSIPQEPQSPSRLQGRVDSPEHLPGSPDNEWPDVPDEGESPRPEENQDIPVVTVGQEQLERSREMQEMGIHNWIAAHDERDPENQPQQVAGVGPYEQ
jgi:hypothetical protein